MIKIILDEETIRFDLESGWHFETIVSMYDEPSHIREQLYAQMMGWA